MWKKGGWMDGWMPHTATFSEGKKSSSSPSDEAKLRPSLISKRHSVTMSSSMDQYSLPLQTECASGAATFDSDQIACVCEVLHRSGDIERLVCP
uniref:Uncharacterized protein n=1 Tax=Syphacia muris TaxID=451379 RepID=A0A0N5A9W7_9BILA